jgi:Kdo2-lipid IVA lauroyltransferase/acyltransferase
MYYLLLAVLYPISLLPLRVLYILSDILFVIVYHLLGYRKELVTDNLCHAFPEKKENELQRIRKQFYRNFCDQWIETVKLISISKAELNKCMSANWNVLQQPDAEGKNVYVMPGHTFNWEWFNVASQWNMQQQCFGVYMPLSSKPADRLMQYIRTRSGSRLISMMGKKSGFQQLQGQRYAVGLVADQNPATVKASLWLPFLNREAPFFRGPEQLASRAKAAVVFVGITKVKRGYYEAKLVQATDNAAEMRKGELMRQYALFMEQQIRQQPENWLWTHRRWKYKKEDYVKVQ